MDEYELEAKWMLAGMRPIKTAINATQSSKHGQSSTGSGIIDTKKIPVAATTNGTIEEKEKKVSSRIREENSQQCIFSSAKTYPTKLG